MTAAIVAPTVPVSWSARDAGAWFDGEAELRRMLAGMAAYRMVRRMSDRR